MQQSRQSISSIGASDQICRNMTFSVESVLYIHGKADDSEKIVLGHVNIPNVRALEKTLSSDDARIQNAYSDATQYLQNFYKPVNKIAENLKEYLKAFPDVKQIKTLGHSCNIIDSVYFQTISAAYDSLNWEFSYHSDLDKCSIDNLCLQCEIKKYEMKQIDQIMNLQ